MFKRFPFFSFLQIYASTYQIQSAKKSLNDAWNGLVMLSGCHITISHCKHIKMTLSNEDLRVAHQHAGETKSREIWEYLFRRLNTRPKEGLNGEGWLVGERRDTPSYALKSSQVMVRVSKLEVTYQKIQYMHYCLVTWPKIKLRSHWHADFIQYMYHDKTATIIVKHHDCSNKYTNSKADW